MIVTDHFVFLHLHKSGGTFVNEALLSFVPGARAIGYHLPRRFVPPGDQHKPVLGTVRNPWSYYVSWYAFQAARPEPNQLFRVLSQDGQLGFEGAIRNMLELGSGGEKLDPLIAALPAGYGGHGLNLPGFALAPIRNSGLGFYSFLQQHIYGGPGAAARLAPMEDMRERLPELMVQAGYAPPETLRRFLNEQPARNTSQHAPYATYYSPALRDLVAERDRALIEANGYSF